MAPTLHNGSTYALTTNGRTTNVKLLRYDPVDGRHVVRAEGSTNEFSVRARDLGKRVRAARTNKIDTTKTYLYLCHTGGDTYKVGASCAPDRRARQIRTYTPTAKMRSICKIAQNKGRDWARVEASVLRQLAAHKVVGGGREVFRLRTPQQVEEAKRAIRRACAA